MHGRVKVKTTEQQNEEKKKKRGEKLLKYNKAKSRIFDKKSSGEFDEEMLKLTEAILYENPDIYTMWNIRKCVFLELAKTIPADSIRALHVKELEFLAVCLRGQPKSYCSWHQRMWVMSNMLTPDWERELELCDNFLHYDERNFHCWDYRRFITKHANVSYSQELSFTRDKISTNFSNYSSWHYRSQLLPLVNPTKTHSWTGMNEETLLNEFELVQNAIFTDPNDQSAWFYHRWLMGRDELPTTVRCIHASLNSKHVYIMFTKSINVNDEDFKLQCNGHQLELTPCGPAHFTGHSILWMGILQEGTSDLVRIGVTHRNTQLCELEACSTQSTAIYNNESVLNTQIRTMSEEKRTALKQELDNCKQLVVMEKDNKWAGLSLVLLLLMVDAESNHEAAIMMLKELALLDPYRHQYYTNLYSNIQIGWEISYNNSHTANTLNLSYKNLTAFSHTDHMLNITSLNISNNNLTNINSLWMLKLLETLHADSNSLSDISVIELLPCLTLLSVKYNLISSLQCLMKGDKLILKTVLINGNPVCEEEDMSVISQQFNEKMIHIDTS